MTLIVQLIAAAAALYVGTKLPDVDLFPLAWKHRSVWTHSPVWLLVLLVPMPWWGLYVPAGLLCGVSVHLALDAFPRAWRGSALINTAPLPWVLPGYISFVWIALSAALCGYAGWIAI